MYKLMRFHATQYNAIYSLHGDFYSISPPYVHTSLVKNEKLILSLEHEPPLKSFKTADGLREYLLTQYYFISLNNFYDLIKKINEGSLIVESLADLNKKLVKKVESFSFLKKDNPLLLRHFLHTFWLLVGVEGHDADELFYSAIKGSDIDALIQKDLKLFATWKADKLALVESIHKTYLSRFKKEKKWEAYKNASFTLFFLSELLGYEGKDGLKAEYNLAIEEYEVNTGKDAHHSPFKRHTDRRSREKHMDEKWKKRQKNLARKNKKGKTT